MTNPLHCFAYVDNPKAPECLRAFLKAARASVRGAPPDGSLRLFATLAKGYPGRDATGPVRLKADTRVRVTAAYAVGDLAITPALDNATDCVSRVAVHQLEKFSEEP
jgi:hypothetical protein